MERIGEAYEQLMLRSGLGRMPDFLAIDLTMAQAKLFYLVCHLGPTDMSSLATHLGVSASTVSEVAERLVEHGVLVRTTDPSDRRRLLLHITDAGQALLDRFREMGSRNLRDLLSVLDDAELKTVERAVRILVDHLPPAPDPSTAAATRGSPR
jgi:DNA-binding MarR family transcriptional regulator